MLRNNQRGEIVFSVDLGMKRKGYEAADYLVSDRFKCAMTADHALIRVKVLIFLLMPLLQGFTLDYSVLSECERRHPNDLLSRLVCNSKVEAEFRESEKRLNDQWREWISLDCVEGQRQQLVSRYRGPLHAFLAEYGNESFDRIHTELKELGYELEARNGKDGLKKIVFQKPIACDTGAALLFNLVFDKDGFVDYLAAWINYPPQFSYGGAIQELQWRRQDKVDQIRQATYLRERAEQEAKVKAREEARQHEAARESALRVLFASVFVLTLWMCIYLVLLFRRKSKAPNGSERYDGSISQNPVYGSDNISEVELFKPREFTQTELKLMSEFRSNHTFVQFDVPPELIRDFLDESMWYKEKTGVYPGIAEQKQILLELRNSRYPS